MKRTQYFFILYVYILSWMTTSFADQLRCGNTLVDTGDTRSDVVEKCGEPVRNDAYCKKEAFKAKYKGKSENSCSKINVWTYNPGYGKFITHIEFKDGKVSDIVYGKRVN